MIVGLTGYKQSGKDTFATVLCAEGGFVRVAFADALKADLAAYLGIEFAQVEEEKEALRRALQLRGTAKRTIDPDYWILLATGKIYAYAEQGRHVVVTDVRYPNEANALRDFNATILRMRRTDQPFYTADPHSSERSVDEIIADKEIACSSEDERIEKAR